MRYIHHLIDNQKFKFISDLGEIGHYEIINSRSTNGRLPDGLNSGGGERKCQRKQFV